MFPSVRAVSHIRVVQVHHKLDTFGIGAQHTKDPNGIAWKQNRDFENLLKRLNADSEHPTGDEADPAPIAGFQPARTNDLTVDVTTVGSGTEGRDEERKVEKERKLKRKRRREETSQQVEKASKKRKMAESTTFTPDTESAEACSSSANMHTRGDITFVETYRSRPKQPLNF